MRISDWSSDVCSSDLLVLRLDLRGLLLVARDDLLLVRRSEDVAERHRDTRTGGPVEAGVLDAVERGCDLHLRVLLGELVDDLRELALVGLLTHERVRSEGRRVGKEGDSTGRSG